MIKISLPVERPVVLVIVIPVSPTPVRTVEVVLMASAVPRLAQELELRLVEPEAILQGPSAPEPVLMLLVLAVVESALGLVSTPQ